ncbi:MAG: aminotransferase class V-fold PLP-dependent enzyme [Alphaproteobacteria bacterium]|nr:aminotransferase class V-fold PLP-dependent enzyme [Alphaproteobacteria bacterium]
MLDLDMIRADTPGTANRIHLNNAGAGLMPKPVTDAVRRHLDLEEAIGGYEAKAEAQTAHDGVYDSIARLIGADRSEIALVENATVAWNKAFFGIQFNEGDRILTCESEYGANYIGYLQMAKWKGTSIEVIPNDSSGAVDTEALRAMLDDRVRLISITHIPTSGGLVNPAEEIGAIAREHNILYLLDACQTLGQMPVDVSAIGCDMLSVTGRKFLRGPRGTGFLYVRSDIIPDMEPPMIDHFAATWVDAETYTLRTDAKLFELWENNYAAQLGLGVAVDYALNLGLQEIRDRALMLATRLREGLAEISGITLRDLGRVKCAIVTFDAAGKPAEDIAAMLNQRRINCSISTADSTMLDFAARKLPSLVRLSPHYYNTEAEIDTALEAVAAAVQ